MTEIFNQKTELEKRRLLRKNSTEAEKLLWNYLRKRQICNERFLRQFSIEQFVLDFYCPSLKLAIELDGEIHFNSEEAIDYDIARQQYIEKLGIRFVRIKNEEVFKDINKVISRIEKMLLDLNQNNSPLNKRGEKKRGS